MPITHRDLMIPSATPAPFTRAGWLFEPKYDGFRIIARNDNGRSRLTSRNGTDLTGAFPELAFELNGLPEVILDGELVVLDDQGKPQFESLRRRARMTGRPGGGAAAEVAAIFAFDMLSFEGVDIRHLSLMERKSMLERALIGGDRIRCVQHVEGEGEALYLAISEVELEGIVAKKGDSPYRSGRTRDWLKVKTPRFKSIEAIRLEHIRK